MKRYSQELFFKDCPHCGAEANMDYVQARLQEVAQDKEKEMIDEQIEIWKLIFDYHSDMTNEIHHIMRNIAHTELDYWTDRKKNI